MRQRGELVGGLATEYVAHEAHSELPHILVLEDRRAELDLRLTARGVFIRVEAGLEGRLHALDGNLKHALLREHQLPLLNRYALTRHRIEVIRLRHKLDQVDDRVCDCAHGERALDAALRGRSERALDLLGRFQKVGKWRDRVDRVLEIGEAVRALQWADRKDIGLLLLRRQLQREHRLLVILAVAIATSASAALAAHRRGGWRLRPGRRHRPTAFGHQVDGDIVKRLVADAEEVVRRDDAGRRVLRLEAEEELRLVRVLALDEADLVVAARLALRVEVDGHRARSTERRLPTAASTAAARHDGEEPT